MVIFAIFFKRPRISVTTGYGGASFPKANPANPVVLFFFLVCPLLSAQNFSDFIRENAISWNSQSLAEATENYKCIMVGEMHGTNEPATFVTELVKGASQKGKKILVGLEISEDDLYGFIKKPSTHNLKKSRFFSKGYGDGRNSEAWFQLIETSKKLPNVALCFFDYTTTGDADTTNRDSMMFVHLMHHYQRDTTQVIYTLSGNIHNKMKPFRGSKTLGCYLVEYFAESSVMSISHLYDTGTMYNRTSEGLKIREMQGRGGVFASAAPFENYFLTHLPEGFPADYTACIFTKTVTASRPVAEKKVRTNH